MIVLGLVIHFLSDEFLEGACEERLLRSLMQLETGVGGGGVGQRAVA